MKKLFLISIFLINLTNLPLQKEVSFISPTTQVEARTLDKRAQILSDYFASYDSPFQYQAQDFIDAADKYGVDWKLVPAISGVESTFGKQSYGYNAWGWGIYGNQTMDFDSWRAGINTVTQGLKQGYIDKGLTDPFTINTVYAASPSWGSKVSYFMNDLDNFARNKGYVQINKKADVLDKTAGASARIALK